MIRAAAGRHDNSWTAIGISACVLLLPPIAVGVGVFVMFAREPAGREPPAASARAAVAAPRAAATMAAAAPMAATAYRVTGPVSGPEVAAPVLQSVPRSAAPVPVSAGTGQGSYVVSGDGAETPGEVVVKRIAPVPVRTKIITTPLGDDADARPPVREATRSGSPVAAVDPSDVGEVTPGPRAGGADEGRTHRRHGRHRAYRGGGHAFSPRHAQKN